MLKQAEVSLAQWSGVERTTNKLGETVHVFVGHTVTRGPSAAAGKGRVPVSALRVRG